jgi:hypothetical protein
MLCVHEIPPSLLNIINSLKLSGRSVNVYLLEKFGQAYQLRSIRFQALVKKGKIVYIITVARLYSVRRR